MKPNFSDAQEKLTSVLDFCRGNQFSSFYKQLPSLKTDSVGEDFVALPAFSKKDFVNTDPYTLLHCAETDIRFLLSTFTPEHDEFFLYPQHLDTVWQSIMTACDKHQPMSLGLMAPAVWQLAPMAFHTCKQAGVPFVALTTINYPLIEQVLLEAEIGVLVTTAEHAQNLLAQAEDAEKIRQQIKAWVIMAPLNAPNVNLDVSGEVVVEYHLFPGVPVAEAVYDVDKKTVGKTVYSLDYLFEFNDQEEITHITSLQHDALPLVRYNPK